MEVEIKKLFSSAVTYEALLLVVIHMGAMGDWDFRISDLVKNP